MEQSAEAVRSLDPEEVADLSMGALTYRNGYFTRHILGEAAVAGGGSVHLAVELPERHCSAQMLFIDDLVQISYMLEHEPGLLSAAPAFVGALSVEGDRRPVSAVIMEDVTEGGRLKLDPQIAAGGLTKSVQLETDAHGPHSLVTAEVDGQTKIMGFFPQPFFMPYADRYKLGFHVAQASDDLTIDIGRDSKLSASLMRHDGIPG